MKSPKFGDKIINLHASPKNPQKEGYFVETVINKSGINNGKHYRITDKNGNFWLLEPKDCHVLYSLDEPYDIKNLKSVLDQNEAKYVRGIVSVDLSEIIEMDLEGFLDLLSSKLIGSELLMDISYKIVSSEGNTLFIDVSGDISEEINL